MARKTSGKSPKPWAPGDPLRLDKAIQRNIPADAIADKLERAGDVLRVPVNNTSHSPKPMSQKTFNRQKKG